MISHGLFYRQLSYFCYCMSKVMPQRSLLGFLPMMFLLSYYTVGTMVDSVDIDNDGKKISITHSPFFFGKKKITYCIDDENFKFSHTSESKTIKSILLRWNTELFWNSLHFYKKDILKVEIYN